MRSSSRSPCRSSTPRARPGSAARSRSGGLPVGNIATPEPTCFAAATPYGTGCAGSGGPNLLAATSLSWLDSTFRSRATGLPANGLALQLMGVAPLSLPLTPLLPFALPSNAVTIGGTIYQQAFGVEFGASGFSALTSTDALLLTIGAL